MYSYGHLLLVQVAYFSFAMALTYWHLNSIDAIVYVKIM